MKYISFKLLIICILLPPVLYVFSIQSLERHLQGRYTKEIEDIYTGDTRPLFDGSIQLKKAINNNIDSYLKSKTLISWGVKTSVTVTTKRNTILYPTVFEDEQVLLLQPDPMKVAADNYNIMNEGLVVNVDLKLAHNTIASNAILAFYIFVVGFVLYFYYSKSINKARREEMAKNNEIARLLEMETKQTDSIKDIKRDSVHLTSEVNKLKNKLENEKIKTSLNEDEMIKEIVSLEDKININLKHQKKKQDEIDALKEKINLLEMGRHKEEKQKAKRFDSIQKRFKALYKNISVHKRALSGFIELTDDMKIKGEEIIHQLNEAPDLVPIKRKVFGKKNREKALEVIFAYRGRLYFRKSKENKIEILAIGTKNTQAKELEFLSNL
ncbi:MAG: hypothetical protein JRF71_12035 [Deltaproteobacteria bacterium]|nr:hypothetical protein [Deltaproteobacteria bacterium]